MMELGRHKNLWKHTCICQVCTKNAEDEIHFLENCEFYAEIRKPLTQYGRKHELYKLRKNYFDEDICKCNFYIRQLTLASDLGGGGGCQRYLTGCYMYCVLNLIISVIFTIIPHEGSGYYKY